jgi:molecular chaperone GrpE
MKDPQDETKDGKKDEEVEYIPAKPEEEGEGPKSPAAVGGPAAPKAGTPAAGAEEARPHKVGKKDAEIRQLRKELDELKDRYLRAAAEMDNLRKRLDRDRAEYTQYALSDLLLELLGILDNLERALGAAEATGDGKSLREGVELILRMYQSLLFKRGVRPVETQDKKFDPNVHHAMITEESDAVSEPEIADVLQKGYRLHSRLLRPALVKVVVPKKD